MRGGYEILTNGYNSIAFMERLEMLSTYSEEKAYLNAIELLIFSELHAYRMDCPVSLDPVSYRAGFHRSNDLYSKDPSIYLSHAHNNAESKVFELSCESIYVIISECENRGITNPQYGGCKYSSGETRELKRFIMPDEIGQCSLFISNLLKEDHLNLHGSIIDEDDI